MLENNLRKKIFIIAGMPRSATTFIYHTFSKHPDVFLPIRKEIEFFSVNYYRGFNWYLKYFNKSNKNKICLDISPGYYLNVNVAKRIYDFNPDIKVVLIVRNVIDWIISYYKHYILYYQKNDTIENFLMDGCTFKVDGIDVPVTFDPGSIYKRIKKYQDVFKKNIILCNFSKIENDPISFFNILEKYFDIRKYFDDSNFNNYKINTGKRSHNSLFNLLMKKIYIVDLIYKLFPRKLTIALRKRFEILSEKKNKNEYNQFDLIDKNKILNNYKNDIDYVNDLFKKSEIIYGNGENFEL